MNLKKPCEFYRLVCLTPSATGRELLPAIKQLTFKGLQNKPVTKPQGLPERVRTGPHYPLAAETGTFSLRVSARGITTVLLTGRTDTPLIELPLHGPFRIVLPY
jgi:hypothetical protein